jgi:ABC-type phosphate transport system substrate-binding protein
VRKLLRILPLALVALAVAGCGVSIEDASRSGEAGPLEQKTAKVASESGGDQTKLPPRTPGVIRIAGQAEGSLTSDLVYGFKQKAATIGFEVTNDEEDDAFEAFCAGKTDIVDSARPISPSEYAGCQANGVEPVQLEVASEAAVLAIANETDVGVDCLSVSDVREIFRAASPVSSWSQVGWGRRTDPGVGAQTIKVAGPEPSANVFGYFGEFVLGDPEPSTLLLRGDYQAYPSERGVLEAVSGNPAAPDVASHHGESVQSENELKRAIKDAVKAVAVAGFQVEKGIEDERSETEQEEDADRVTEAEAKVQKLEAELAAVEAQAREEARAVAEVATRLGTLGLFRFSYYGLWEERLRPMEISATAAEGSPECIFPSQSTITDGTYPLARQLLLTVNLPTMKEAEVSEFLAYAVTESQPIASAASLVPLPDEVRNTELAWLKGEIAPDVVYYPPAQVVEDEGGEEGQGTSN